MTMIKKILNFFFPDCMKETAKKPMTKKAPTVKAPAKKRGRPRKVKK
tara:strand:+ start:150 stop:290 length:141 start_codon:yes stop_codon:yes gene_type:complete